MIILSNDSIYLYKRIPTIIKFPLFLSSKDWLIIHKINHIL